MEFRLFVIVVLSFISGSNCEYCSVSVPGHHNSYQIRCSSSCCGSGYDTRCCVSGDMIVGIFFACVACVTILVTLLYCCIKHKTNRDMRQNSRNPELSFLGSNDRFYQPFPAQPVKPPPYKKYDPPPSYTERPGTTATIQPTQATTSIFWTRRPPPNVNTVPRQILVSSPPPPYDSRASTPVVQQIPDDSPTELPPSQIQLSTSNLGDHYQVTEIPNQHRSVVHTTSDNNNNPGINPDIVREVSLGPSTSQTSNVNQPSEHERVVEMFRATPSSSINSYSAYKQQRRDSKLRTQAEKVQKQLGRTHPKPTSKTVRRQSPTQTPTKRTLSKINSV
ncbi:hypothetical protein LOTGIDRAFT_231094 [Lottia gigantea]|uniref:Vesicular, overexpressed in cancer, prosurvival protein 1 n=1 Tax=Lottia gigantea TaxID=225164 RepID=V4CC71_LOTGI|nr:hypothetical protein LOTGIDRAFT_231094 [Lottia gigantea]ESO99479.1 hypothetical protein LOTGIDRAFT_231094 [Lottia gigantea]